MTTIATLNAKYGPELQAAQHISLATVSSLLQNPTDQSLQAKAVQEMTSAGVSSAEAVKALQTLAQIPQNQLVLVSSKGQQVLNAEAALKDLGSIPGPGPGHPAGRRERGRGLTDPVAALLLGRGGRRDRLHPADLPARRPLEPEAGP